MAAKQKQVTVTVFGANYTGFKDDADDKAVKVVLTGHEDDIVYYIRSNFSRGFGEEYEPTTLDQLEINYRAEDEPMFDRCGGVFRITNAKGKTILEMADIFPPWEIYTERTKKKKKTFDNVEWLDLGEVLVGHREGARSVGIDDPFHGHVNRLVRAALEKPTRKRR